MHKYVYLMAVPVIAFYVIFHYMPMYGAIIAFKNFRPGLGIWGSPWVGLTHFESFFSGVFFGRLIRNTLTINFYALILGFPAPIILALLLNEVRHSVFKRAVQTISYLPYFISVVVVCGMIMDFFSGDGLVNYIITAFGGDRVRFLARPEYFRSIFVGSGIWQGVGWGSIIYLAAISGIDAELYEAAVIDGAGRWKQILHVTLPGLSTTIIILLILRFGEMMTIGYEKIILLYNPSTYETADVISSYVYRRGLLKADYSFSTAVGLFNSAVNLVLLYAANTISRKVNDTSLW